MPQEAPVTNPVITPTISPEESPDREWPVEPERLCPVQRTRITREIAPVLPS